MFECVNCFLDSQLLPVQHIIEGSPNPSVFKETEDSLVKYLIDKLVEDHQCLFHLDEHRKMFPTILDEGTGKDFYRITMEVLISKVGIIVIGMRHMPGDPRGGSNGRSVYVAITRAPFTFARRHPGASTGNWRH